MSLVQAIVLGFFQGLTEFVPISSTAHLRIVPALLGWEDPGAAFTAVTQLGTVAAVLLYFRTDLIRIVTAWLSSLRRPEERGGPDARMGWYIIVGTIPIGVMGLALKDQVENGARNLYLIGIALIALGLVMHVADVTGRRDRDLASVRLPDAVWVGLAQALALIPGVSRSGATISAGLFRGFQRATAARFSFLLSIPAIVLSGLLKLVSIVRGEEAESTSAADLAVATAVAFGVGYASIALLLRWLSSHSTAIFVAYRIVLGTIVLILAGAGVIG